LIIEEESMIMPRSIKFAILALSGPVAIGAWADVGAPKEPEEESTAGGVSARLRREDDPLPSFRSMNDSPFQELWEPACFLQFFRTRYHFEYERQP
jgi:hypothetical protein